MLQLAGSEGKFEFLTRDISKVYLPLLEKAWEHHEQAIWGASSVWVNGLEV